MHSRKLSFTTRYVLLFGVLLFVANTVLGFLILDQSKTAMRALINKDMLDVVNSAAATMDGDVLGALTEDDVGGPEFMEVARRLLAFQNSEDIHFIYAVRQVGDRYVFTVDPDPVDPGAFGEEVVTTPALVQAAAGTPAVDDKPEADRWGNFYSAYSPVRDSVGNVAGVVGIDFDATWYDDQVQRHTFSIAVVTAATVLVGVVAVALITNRVRSRFRDFDTSLSDLSVDVDVLMEEMSVYSGLDLPVDRGNAPLVKDVDDELEAIGSKIRTMHSEMKLYLDYLHTQAYTDSLTRVGNSASYHELIADLERQIEQGMAEFCVVVFDVNGLKELNDTYGHECGDIYIQGVARVLAEALGDGRVFRIGGDEFAAVMEGGNVAQVESCLRAVEAGVCEFNASTRYPVELAVAQGVAQFDARKDASYKDVFARADKNMYANKRAYYEAGGAGH